MRTVQNWVEKEDMTIPYDMPIQTNREVTANHPDIVIKWWSVQQEGRRLPNLRSGVPYMYVFCRGRKVCLMQLLDY